MNRSERISQRNARMNAFGLGIALIGALVSLFAITYIASPEMVSVLALKDGMIKLLAVKSWAICSIGLIMATLGTFFAWRAETSQEALETTTRFVDFDELKARQASRR